MKNKFLLKSFRDYLDGMAPICARALALTFFLGGLAMAGVAISLIYGNLTGIRMLEAEAAPIMIYIFRSVCIAEFFLLLLDYTARSSY